MNGPSQPERPPGDSAAEIAALRRAEARYRTMVEWSPEPIFVHCDDRFVYVNPAAMAMFGADTAAQLIGMPVIERVHPDYHQSWLERAKIALERGVVPEMLERRFLRFDGGIIFAEARGALIEHEGRPAFLVVMRDITAQRLAEAASREAEARWRLALEGAGHGVFDEDLVTGRFIYSWPHAATLGYTMEEFASLPHWTKRVHPEDLPAVLAARQAHLDGLTPSYLSERRVLCKDGSWKWIQLRAMVVSRDANGRPLRMIGTNTDISAGKRAEEEVRLTEERWRLALEGAGHGVFDENLLTGELTLSPRYIRALGYSMEEFAALPHWEKRVHPDDLPASLAARQAHLSGATPNYLSERRMLCKDGSWKWIQLRGMVMTRDAQGKPLRMIGTHTDISARKRAEAEARLADERWRLSLEGADHGVWDEDLVTGTIIFSRPYVESLGYTMDEFTGLVRDWKYRVHPEDLPTVLAARKAHLEGAAPKYLCERRMRCKDGSWKWMQTRGMVVTRDAQGKPLRMIGTHTDISERKQAEAALQESHDRIKDLTRRVFKVQEEERTRLARTLHDDLAQTLTATACLAQSLCLDLERRWQAGFEQASRIEQQLSDVVERARLLAQGLLPLASQVGSISTALEQLARHASEIYRIDCRFVSEPAEIMETEEVAQHLYYIAQEGVLNAVKHGQASSVTISLSLAQAGRRPRLLVADDGRGVNEACRLANRGVGLHLIGERCRAMGMQMTLGRNPEGGALLRVE